MPDIEQQIKDIISEILKFFDKFPLWIKIPGVLFILVIIIFVFYKDTVCNYINCNEEYLDYERTVDFSQLKCDVRGKKDDIVEFYDRVTFSTLPKENKYTREFRMPQGATLTVTDEVDRNKVKQPYKIAGRESIGEVMFKIDQERKEAKLRWIYENAYSGDNEGVGFSSSKTKIRRVSVRYKLPVGTDLKNREFIPTDLKQKCILRDDGYECENLDTSAEFREVWNWNVWASCKK